MKYYSKKIQPSKSPQKPSEPIPVTKLDEETIARDTRTYFKEIIKNTKTTTVQEQTQQEEKTNRKPAFAY